MMVIDIAVYLVFFSKFDGLFVIYSVSSKSFYVKLPQIYCAMTNFSETDVQV